MKRTSVFVALVLAMVAGAGRALAEPPGYSGCARLDDATFLVVHDRKDRDGRTTDGRLGLVGFGDAGVSYSAVSLEMKAGMRPPSDLEACCALPGRPGEYLAAESGFYKGHYGRVLRIHVDPSARHARVLDAIVVRAPPQGGTTPRGEQFEGMDCVRTPRGRLVLLLGALGDASTAARLHWGELSLAGGGMTWRPLGDVPLLWGPPPLGGRACASLHARPVAGGWRLWCAATEDRGDLGPFRSRIYEAGILVLARGPSLVCWRPWRCPLVRWSVDGLKVEGMAAPGPKIAGTELLVLSDDEDYGGACRALGRP